MIKLPERVTQQEFGELVGITQPAVSDLTARGIIGSGQTADQWLKAYCAHLREEAAGRANHGLAIERAALAKAQRERVEMQNAVTRRQLAPIILLEQALADAGRQIVAIFEAIPVQLKRRSSLPAEDIEFVASELIKARNVAAAIEITLPDTDDSNVDASIAEVDD